MSREAVRVFAAVVVLKIRGEMRFGFRCVTATFERRLR